MVRLLAALFAALALACGPAAAQHSVVSVPSAVQHFLGATAMDFAGHARATVADVEFDLANGAVRYAILELDGRRLAYPFARFEVSLDGRHLLIHDSAERLARAPGLDECAGSPRWAAYWAATQPPRLAPASELIGHRVNAADGIGQLADIVIDAADGEVAFAVLRLPVGRLHPVPLRAIAQDGRDLVLAVPFADLDRSHDMTATELADLRDRPILARRLARYAERLAP
jgi:hypothetical protein